MRALRSSFAVACVVMAIFYSGISTAALTQADLFTTGDGLITYDDATGLQWLDVTETRMISVDDINAGVGGWTDLGFRYATTAEVGTLMNHAGLTDLTGVSSTESFAAAQLFISLLGNTSGNTLNAATTGRAGVGDFGPGTVNVPTIIASYNNTGYAKLVHSTGIPASYEWNNNSGSFLVRTAPPLPASFTSLGELPNLDFGTVANDVSADGSTIIGYIKLDDTNTDSEAFRWTATEGIVRLGDISGGRFDSEAVSVSQSGSTIVGNTWSASGIEAFRWTPQTGMVALGTIPDAWFFRSNGRAVSADGNVVAGWGPAPLEGYEAWRWSEAGGIEALGDLPGGYHHSDAADISADGSVIVGKSYVGFGTSDDTYYEAFIWTEADGMQGLGDLPGSSHWSQATKVSGDGQVVVGWGSVWNAGNVSQAFRWTRTGGMVGLELVPGYPVYSIPTAVSYDGSRIIGKLLDNEYFYWDLAGGMRKFNDLINELKLDTSGWTLQPLGFAENGNAIIGVGTSPQGLQQVWRLRLQGIVVEDVDLALTGSMAAEMNQGDIKTLTLQVTNQGSTNAPGAAVVVNWPSGLKVLNISSSAASCTLSNNKASCAIGDIAPGSQAVVVTASIQATASGSQSLSANVASNANELTPSDNSKTFSVNVNALPIISLVSPTSGALYTVGDTVSLQASATDAEDGNLDSAIQWSSSLDGFLGTGATVVTASLSEGTHLLNVSVSDSKGASSNLAISITIEPVVSGPVAYCSASGSNTSYEWINQVTVAGHSNFSGNNNGFADYTAGAEINLLKGSSSISLQPGFRYGSYTENWAIWIDFNQDGQFDSAERVYAASSSSTLNGTISVPADAKAGLTRMRVAMRWGGSPQSCGSFYYGEVEDYTVNIAP